MASQVMRITLKAYDHELEFLELLTSIKIPVNSSSRELIRD